MASVISNLPMFQGASGNVSFDNLASRQVLTHTMHTTTHAWQALHSTVCVYSVHTHKHTHTHTLKLSQQVDTGKLTIFLLNWAVNWGFFNETIVLTFCLFYWYLFYGQSYSSSCSLPIDNSQIITNKHSNTHSNTHRTHTNTHRSKTFIIWYRLIQKL